MDLRDNRQQFIYTGKGPIPFEDLADLRAQVRILYQSRNTLLIDTSPNQLTTWLMLKPD